MNKFMHALVVVVLGLGMMAFAEEEESSPIAPQSFDGFGGIPQQAFAPAQGDGPPVFVAKGPKAPVKNVKQTTAKAALKGKSKGKWVSAKDLKAKRNQKTAAKAAAKPKKPVAKAKSGKGRNLASVKKKPKKAK